MNSILSFILSGISSKSGSLSFGKNTFFMLDLEAAMIFSFNPPIANTLPVKVISPVIAIELSTLLFNRALRRAVVRVTPALGPSLGIAPSGT